MTFDPENCCQPKKPSGISWDWMLAIAAWLVVALFAAMAFGTQPVQSEPVRERCDVIWLDSLYDLEGRCYLTQLIFLDWDSPFSRYDVIAWRSLHNWDHAPNYGHARGMWSVCFYDAGYLRMIEAPSFRQTWSQGFDPERDELQFLPAEHRRGLAIPVSRRKPPP